MDGPYVHRGLGPPPQRLIGDGFKIYINEDTAPRMRCVSLRRRARRLLSGGVISGRLEEVTYEVRKDGHIDRIDEMGIRKRVPEGHAEWRWARDALNWLWKRTFEGARAAGQGPTDLVGWKIRKPQITEG